MLALFNGSALPNTGARAGDEVVGHTLVSENKDYPATVVRIIDIKVLKM